MVIPEIDMPGHTNAALVAYPELAKKGVTPSAYTGREVGFSTLDTDNALTYRFVDDVVRELAAITPGGFLHIGGDEAFSTPEADYIRFMQRVQEIVAIHDKRMIGWEEIGKIDLRPDSIAQHWNSKLAVQAADQGARVIMSPARHTYLDLKYYPEFDLGHNWAGATEVQAAYEWDPATHIDLLSENDILGVEAPLWSEWLHNLAEIDRMAFPRLPGIAEIGWSRPDNRHWGEYRLRLASHGPRLEAMGVNFYPSSQVPWENQSVPGESVRMVLPATR
jgi:hexosaminidase